QSSALAGIAEALQELRREIADERVAAAAPITAVPLALQALRDELGADIRDRSEVEAIAALGKDLAVDRAERVGRDREFASALVAVHGQLDQLLEQQGDERRGREEFELTLPAASGAVEAELREL